MTSPVQRTFSGGEISPTLFSRVDLSLYQKSVRTLRNMICMRQGGVTERPGTMYVGTTLNGGNPVRLIPFIFNETGLGQSYVLEFGNHYIAFYQNGGVVVTAPNTPYTIVSPYAQADLNDLRFDQNADVVTITHKSYWPRELARLAPTNWTLTQITFSVRKDTTTVMSAVGTPGALSYQYTITSIFDNDDETASTSSTDIFVPNVTQPSPSAPINLQWTGPPLPNPFNFPVAVRYKVYRAQVSGATNPVVYGYVGTVAAPVPHNPATTVSFLDNVATPDYTQAPPVSSPFEVNMGVGYYPAEVGFIQQRRVFANWINNPLGVAMSAPGSFKNFDLLTPQTDSSPIFFTIAGSEVNQIEHIVELKAMLAMTAGGEIYVQGNGSGVVTPSAINAVTQSHYGSSPLRPLLIGDILLFNQALGSFVRDFSFDFIIDGYRGNDITLFASHLFEGYSLVDWAFQKVPDSIAWAVRSDGVLLSCSYIREQQILAWAHHDFENGVVENICSIPENGEYAVYLSIKRVINGATVRYIERVSSRIWTDPLTATYLDCFSSYDGRNTTAVAMVLYQASGGDFVTDGTAYQQQLILRSSSAYFTAGMVGDQIFLEDDLFISSQGKEGNQVRCTIQAFVDTTHVTVTPSGAVPTEFQSFILVPLFRNITTWSRAVKSLSGLDFLEGQEVSVWADRFVVASPNNSQYQTLTVTAGAITLDKQYAVIYVGLPITYDVETLDIDTAQGDSILDTKKDISRVAAYVINTRGMFAGQRNPDTDHLNTTGDPLFGLMEKKPEAPTTYVSPWSLESRPVYINIQGNWNRNGRVFIRQVDPVPMTIISIVPEGKVATNSQNLRV